MLYGDIVLFYHHTFLHPNYKIIFKKLQFFFFLGIHIENTMQKKKDNGFYLCGSKL